MQPLAAESWSTVIKMKNKTERDSSKNVNKIEDTLFIEINLWRKWEQKSYWGNKLGT